MLNKKSIGVVIPAHNEHRHIGTVIHNIPKFVDKIIVINDGSTDNTGKILSNLTKKNKKIIIITHSSSKGVGGAIASGYLFGMKNNLDALAVMAGDNQMDPDELHGLCLPIINNECDYVKGNRFLYGDAWRTIPKVRYFGNAVLSLLTKIASGYWWVSDSQTGYTVIATSILQYIDLDNIYHNYGFPNDMLVKLNAVNARVRDVPIKPIYDGQKSGIKLHRVIPRISYLLIRLFFWRLKDKYIIRNFHPLVFFYTMGFILFPAGFAYGVYLLYLKSTHGSVATPGIVLDLFLLISGIQFFLFAMWFDMEDNRDLKA